MVLEEVQANHLVQSITSDALPQIQARVALVPVVSHQPEGALRTCVEVFQRLDLELRCPLDDLAAARLEVTPLVPFVLHVVLLLDVKA